MFWEKCYGIVATFLKRKKCRTFITWTNLGAGGKRKLYKINGHWPLRVGEGQAKSVKDCTKTLLLIFHCWYLCSFTKRKIIFRYKNLTHKKKTFFVLPDILLHFIDKIVLLIPYSHSFVISYMLFPFVVCFKIQVSAFWTQYC